MRFVQLTHPIEVGSGEATLGFERKDICHIKYVSLKTNSVNGDREGSGEGKNSISLTVD